MTTPSAIRLEPTYNGCRVQRYGPERVTSRPFSRWPAAQARKASPPRATTSPMHQLLHVGSAKISATTAAMNPSDTRLLASVSTGRARSRAIEATNRDPDPLSMRSDAAADRGGDLLDVDVIDTAAGTLALTLVMTHALPGSRDGYILACP